MYLRRRGTSDQLVSFASSGGSDTVTTPTGLIARREEQGLILRAFEQLSEEQKMVIELFYWGGMAVAEIGQVLLLSVSAVTSRLSRARGAMRSFLESLQLRESARHSVLSDMDRWARSLREDG